MNKFIEEFNNNVITEEFKASCRKAASLFQGGRKMHKIAKFEKVSFAQFKNDYAGVMWHNEMYPMDESLVEDIYNNIELPKRATTGSAGYDFHAPYAFSLKPGESIKIPTGIRVKMDEGWVMLAVPRSSAGIKKGIQLLNTVCVGDSDYYNANNEGHYFMAIRNASDKTVTFEAGERFVQAVFVPFGITVDDEAEAKRTGGIGSSGK